MTKTQTSSSSSSRWAKAERLATTLGSILKAGDPVLAEEGATPSPSSVSGKVVLLRGIDPKLDTDTLGALVDASAVTVVAVDLPELVDGEGLGFSDLSSALTEAKLPLAWEGLTFSEPDRFERQAGLFVLSAEHRDRLASLMETGVANLALHAGNLDPANRPARVVVASNEIFGPTKNGGIGTACTSLAHALAEAGNEVTILFFGDTEELEKREVDLAEWERHYGDAGIRFVALVPAEHPELDWEHFNIRTAHAAYSWLSEEHARQPLDVIHFAECNGHGYFTTLAKRLGLDFADVLVSLTTHSSTQWIFESNHVPFESYLNFSTDWLERRSVEDCDLLIGPSLYLLQWMRTRDWTLPGAVHQQQYIQPQAARRDIAIGTERQPVDEIVFFGRLETRKGLVTFCDALDAMAGKPECDGVEITFLGKEAMVEGEFAKAYLARRSAKWRRHWQIIDNYDQDEAIEYLRGEGRLACMPSIVDNSPNTVYECIGVSVPFIAARTGGIPELIRPGDVAATTIYDVDVEERGAPLAEALLRVCREGKKPTQPAVQVETNDEVWIRWHRQMATRNDQLRANPVAIEANPAVAVCLAFRESDAAKLRKATLAALASQTQAPEAILVASESGVKVDDLPAGATHVGELTKCDEASLWNHAAASAESPLLLFVSVGVELHDDAIETLARGAQCGGFDGLTAYREDYVAPKADDEEAAEEHVGEIEEDGLGRATHRAPEPARDGSDDKADGPGAGTAAEGLLAEYPIGGHPASNLLKASTGNRVLLLTRDAYQAGGSLPRRPDGDADLTSYLVGLAVAGRETAAIPRPLWQGDPLIDPDPDSSAGYALGQALLDHCDPLVDNSLRHLPGYARAQSERAHRMIDHMDWLKSELTAHQALLEEIDTRRSKEKSKLKEQISKLKKNSSKAQAKLKKAEANRERPGLGKRLERSFRKRIKGKK